MWQMLLPIIPWINGKKLEMLYGHRVQITLTKPTPGTGASPPNQLKPSRPPLSDMCSVLSSLQQRSSSNPNQVLLFFKLFNEFFCLMGNFETL